MTKDKGEERRSKLNLTLDRDLFCFPRPESFNTFQDLIGDGEEAGEEDDKQE